MAKRNITDCPGGWYGCQPTTADPKGHVVVDPERVADAVRWLARHRYAVVKSRIVDRPNDGVRLDVALR